MSVKSGRCFSRDDALGFRHGGRPAGTTTIGSRSAESSRRCSIASSRSAACASPMRRSQRFLAPPPCAREQRLDAGADALHHAQPRDAEQQRRADGEQREQQQRRAVEADAVRQVLPDDVAERAARLLRQRRGQPIKADAIRARRSTAAPARSRRRRARTDDRSHDRDARRGDSRRRRARRRQRPTTTPTGRTGRAAGRTATRRRRRRDWRSAPPVPGERPAGVGLRCT